MTISSATSVTYVSTYILESEIYFHKNFSKIKVILKIMINTIIGIVGDKLVIAMQKFPFLGSYNEQEARSFVQPCFRLKFLSFMNKWHLKTVGT